MRLYKQLVTSLLFVFLYISLSSSSDKATSAATIQSKLNALESEIPMVYNEHVQGYINVYTVKKRELATKIVTRADYYFPMFEKVLETFGIPKELKYLAVIESALNPHAVSPKGATGIWQFMYSTAKLYKLDMNNHIDERKDPYLSSIAAATYLKNSYNMFDDWLLAIASYNCGPGNVKKAIKKAGGKKDFWKIYQFLPKETRGYVPAFIAAAYFMNYQEEFGLEPNEAYVVPATTSYKVVGDLYLQELVAKLEIDEETFRWLNAAVKGDIIPANYQVHIPQSKAQAFLDQIDSLYAISEIKIEELALSKKPAYTASSSKTSSSSTKPANTKTKTVVLAAPPKPKERKIDPNKVSFVYTVKGGDNLGMIANWFDCNVDDVKFWNDIRKNKIVIEQELLIYVEPKDLAHYQRFEHFSTRLKNVLSTDRQKRLLYTPEREANSVFHKVEKGETLSVIAKSYEVSIDEIKQHNCLDKQCIMPGMYLKISSKQL